MARQKKAHVIDNEAFYDAIVRWKAGWKKDENGKPIKEVINEELARDFVIPLVEHTINSGRFRGYSDDWREQMYSNSIFSCVKYLGNFDTEKYNSPFNYVLTMVMKLCKTVIVEEKLKIAAKERYRLHILDEMNLYDSQDDGASSEVNEFEELNNLGAKNFSSDTAQRYFEYEQIHRKPQKRKKKNASLDEEFE